MDQVKICPHQTDLSNHDMVSVNYADSIIVHWVMDERDDNFVIDYIYHHLYDTESSTFDFQLRMKHHQGNQECNQETCIANGLRIRF